MKIFNSVSQMKQATLTTGQQVKTKGYYAANDRLGAEYYIAAAATVDEYGDHTLANGNIALLNSDTINVKLFGAKGDDSTDDTAAFLAAVDAMAANSTLYIPAGIYIVNDTLDFTGLNDISIIGEGWGATVIKRTNGTFGDTALFSATNPTTSQARGITIKDMQFYAAVDVTTGAVLHFKNTIRADVQSVFIRNCNQGIQLEGIRDSRFDNIEIVTNEFFTVHRATSAHLVIDPPTDTDKKSTETFFSNYNFTTAGSGVDQQEDVKHCIWVRGALDGIWFSDGHSFGGKTSNLMIDGNNQYDMSSLWFDKCWFDQFTPRNAIIQGDTSVADQFRLTTFSGCRFWGGTQNNISVDVASGIDDLTFEGCEVGVTQGQGMEVGAGQLTITGCIFKGLNQSSAAGGYAVNLVPASNTNTKIDISNCVFECQRLQYVVWIQTSVGSHNINNNVFKLRTGTVDAEIQWNYGTTWLGTCSNNSIDSDTVGNITGAATLSPGNLAVDTWNVVGGAVTISRIEPFWQGRVATFKADTSTVTFESGTGNIITRSGSDLTMAVDTTRSFVYYSDTARWHQL